MKLSRLFLSLIALFLIKVPLSAQTCNIDSDASIDFQYHRLSISEAGTDFTSTLETEEDDLKLSVYFYNRYGYIYNYGGSWRVQVKRIDYGWPQDFKLSVRRTDQGETYYRPLSGGLSYMEVSKNNRVFLEGRGYHMKIPLQFKVENLSVTIPSGFYCTFVIFTLMDN